MVDVLERLLSSLTGHGNLRTGERQILQSSSKKANMSTLENYRPISFTLVPRTKIKKQVLLKHNSGHVKDKLLGKSQCRPSVNHS